MESTVTDERINELIDSVGCGGCDSTGSANPSLALCGDCIRKLVRLVEREVIADEEGFPLPPPSCYHQFGICHCGNPNDDYTEIVTERKPWRETPAD